VHGSKLLEALGERVRALRQERGLTLRELSRAAGLSERFLSDLESGRANISVLNLEAVAGALGSSAAALLAGGAAGQPERKVISLLGLRGAGKSSVGKALGERLKISFLELDRLVEAEAGMTLPELFAIHGEEYYRRVELLALKRFLGTGRAAVLATGGGVVTSPEAMRLLQERTTSIWLKATPDEHWDRVVKQGDLRPMQNRPQAMAELRRRLREREPLYARASLTCATTGRSVHQVVADLSARLG
jgi:XRE family aerobic/anaerobic benzoate catabolism transcriptional regulator